MIVSFAFMAHVDPPSAVHGSWIVGLIAGLMGGRPGLISGTSSAAAAVIGSYAECTQEESIGLVCHFHHVEIVFPAVIIAGGLMFVFAYAKLSCLIQLFPTPVMIGCKLSN
eukprot:GHVN01051549.1.p1 GENE.GHVN01051549.1~~GHVN01051549.1.p1  ORF type:complete len:111 (-),score=9.99 GHVN01051549.1:78-410(-)